MGFFSSIAKIAGVVLAPFTGGASLFLTAAAFVAPKVIDKVFDFVMKPFMGMMGIPTGGFNAGQEAERQQGVLIQRQGSMSNIPVVYGFRKVGDIVTFAETGSSDNKYLWVAHVYSEGRVAGLNKLFIDDYELPQGVAQRLNAGQIVTISEGKYKDRVKLQFFPGVYYADPRDANHITRQTCFFNTDSERPPTWKPEMVYNGLAVVFARYEWKKITTQEEADANPFGYNIPALSVEMFGKILSPIPSTAPANEYDSDSARYEVITTGSGQTIGYANPAEVLLDYLRNPRYGKGLKNADIDWPSWYVAAQKCKTEVTYAGGIKGPIMSMNFVLPTEQSIFNNVKALLSNFRGYMPYVQGKYKLKIEDAGDPIDILSGSAEVVAQFNKDNIVGEITYTGVERTNKYNQMVVSWVDPDNKWSTQEVIYPETEAERQAFIEEDGGRENKGTFTASGITNIIMAKDLARILFWKSRLSDTISFTASSQAIELEPGDCINVKGNVLTFTDTYPWRVVSLELNSDMTVNIGAVYNPDTIWPYTRWNEPDRFLPVYVPKGAEIVRPKITPSQRNGLLPPYPDKPLAPVSGIPVAPGKEDFITITKFDFIPLDGQNIGQSGNIYVDVYFTQPPATMYGGVNMYYKEARDSVLTYTLVEVPLSPGAGRQIIARFGPVVLGKTYELKTRVYYVTGENSTKQANYAFTVGIQSVTPQPPFAGTPTPTPTPVANLAEDTFASVSAEVQVNGSGQPLTPRRLAVTLSQDITNGTNPYLNGLEIFYKQSVLGEFGKWNRTRIPVTGTQGDPITFSLELGTPLYPLIPGQGGTPTSVDNYDFIFRWTYSDGKSSVYQWHARNCSIEHNGVNWGPFNPFEQGGISIQAKSLSKDYVPQIATAEDVIDPRNTQLSTAYKIEDGGAGATGIKFTFYPPTEIERTWWRGVRVYYTKAGTAVTNTYTDYIPATFANNEWSVTLTSITYDDVWEYVIVPIVRWGTQDVEANRSQYLWGKIHNRPADVDFPYPANGNWYSSMRISSLEDTAVAKARRGTAIPAPPRTDTYLDTFSSTTLLSAGQPFEARRMQFTFKQSVANGTNNDIAGYAVYYKQSDARYWKRSTFAVTGYGQTPPPTITFGSHEMDPPMDLGFRSYPNFPARDQNYDFLVRFYYTNNTESIYESAYLNVKIEDNGVPGTPVYLFSPLGTPGTATYRKSESVILENFAPPGDVVDVRDILSATSMYPLELQALEPPSTNNRIRFGFNVPIGTLKAYLAGFRILRRPVIAGAAPQPTEDNSSIPYSTATTTINGASTALVCAVSAETVWNREYEWAVIPIVWYQGRKVEANRCIYWRGRVSDRTNALSSNPYTTNWFSVRQPEILTPAEVRSRLNAPFANTDPTVILQSITRVNPNYGNPGGDALGYWEINYTLPANYQSITVFRRQARDWQTTQFGGNGSYYDKANFGGAGQWERILINNSNFPPINVSGVVQQTIRVRPAIADFFNDETLASGYKVYQPRSTVKGGPNCLYKGQNVVPPGGTGNQFPKYWLLGDTNKGSNATGYITQLLIVVTTTNPLVPAGNVSSNGILLDLYNEKYVNGVLTRNAPGNIFGDAQIVRVADINAQMDISALNLSAYGITPTPTVDPSWTTLLRKPSEFFAQPANSSIVQPGTVGWTTNYNPGASPTVV